MTAVRILQADVDRSEWLEIWSNSGREPFAHPSYCRLFTGSEDEPVLAVVTTPHGAGIVPLILRSLTSPGDSPASLVPMMDATSPYGYGGPYGVDTEDLWPLLQHLHQWASEKRLPSVFLRLALDARVEPKGDDSITVVDSAENIIVDLNRPTEDVWMSFEHKVRKNVKKSIRAGCAVEEDDEFKHLDDFVAVYSSTMSRRSASAFYQFDRSFFARIAEELAGSYRVFYVRGPEGAIVSVELVLVSDQYFYSFLGGTLESAFSLTPNDLLKWRVIERGRTEGKRAYILGGGAARGDGIFRYKRSFSPNGERMFRTVRMVTDPQAYRDLTGPLRDGGRDGDFFPAYRAPLSS